MRHRTGLPMLDWGRSQLLRSLDPDREDSSVHGRSAVGGLNGDKRLTDRVGLLEKYLADSHDGSPVKLMRMMTLSKQGQLVRQGDLTVPKAEYFRTPKMPRTCFKTLSRGVAVDIPDLAGQNREFPKGGLVHVRVSGHFSREAEEDCSRVCSGDRERLQSLS